MRAPLASVEVRSGHDVVLARQRARQIAGQLGFETQDQTRFAAAVSEIARNAYQYAGGGRVEFSFDDASPPLLLALVSDQGPGIADPQRVLEGRASPEGGPVFGLVGAKRLMDHFELETSPGRGTHALFGKRLPKGAPLPTPAALARLRAELGRPGPEGAFEEVQRQNQELLRAFAELRAREAELEAQRDDLRRLNDELVDTNRGIFALHDELHEQMALLQESTGQKLRFLSHVSHEIRTPISAVMGLAELVLDDPEGLSAENRQALGLIRKSAVELSTLVNDLLDVAKLEAGRFEIRPERFLLEEVVGAMRGTFRVLHTSEHVALRLGPVDAIPALFTDRGKVAQIVRNLVSNALKFTERGEVALDARLVGETWVEVLVSDTGLGIDPAEHERVFEEFTQAHNHLQARAGGTGLGLLISRRLARLLGGDLTLRASGAGLGSTFALLLPLAYPGAEGAEVAPAGTPPGANAWRAEVAGEGPLLVIDDDASWRRSLRQQLATLGRATVVEAADGERGLALARELSPDAIVLDFDLPGRDGLAVLRDLRADPATRSIPVVLHTAKHFSSAERRELLAAAVDVLSKDEDAEAWSSALARALADALARRRDAEGRPEQAPSRGESSS